MLPKNPLDDPSSADCNVVATRRTLMLAALAAGLPLAASSKATKASKLDPAETMITFPDAIKFVPWSGAPPHSGEVATLYGGLDTSGPYLVLMKWYPGYMSAPHKYVTDRLGVVVSGTWWINSGEGFDPANCVPVPAGTFTRRIAGTWHYDGVIATGKEPVVIAICGIGPVNITYAEPDKPGWRAV